MATISQIRSGLKTRLATISGLRALEYVPGTISPPMACVGGPEIRFDKTFGRGSDDFTIPIMVFASKASERGGQQKLDGYLDPSGPTSIKAAIEGPADTPEAGTLGGVVDFAWVKEVREYGPYDFGEGAQLVTYIGAVLMVEITA